MGIATTDTRTWFDDQLDAAAFDIDAAYERVHNNHVARGIPAKWSDSQDLRYCYCLAQGIFEHHGPYCGYRVPAQPASDASEQVSEMKTELEAVTPMGEQGEWRLSAPMVNRAIADGIRGGTNITAIDIPYPEGRKHYGQVVVFESPELAAQIVRDHNALPTLYEALKEILNYGVEFDDSRMGYVVAQVNREAIADARAALALVDGPQTQETK